MARRTATPATPAPPAPLPPPPRDVASLAESDPVWAANLHTLRQHWKWANFSQFFYTFAPLLAMPDVFLADVEDDLARGTNLYLPRIMQRLLYTLSQDRKINITNWQTALRKQYLRRAPELNPIGPEPKAPSRESSVAPSHYEEEDTKDNAPTHTKPEQTEDVSSVEAKGEQEVPESSQVAAKVENPEPKAEPDEDSKVPPNDASEEQPKAEEVEESKDWLDLPMLAKLDSLHLLTDWQFQHPSKVRQLMKDDDEYANWRIEPIGYDAKTNAYWLIGPDRLWIQRVPPKPPRTRSLKRKRPAATAKKASTKASTSKAAESASEDEDDEPVSRPKRTRTHTQQSSSRAQTNSRATRATRRTRASSPATADLSSPGKSARAAKVQANKKLDLQAKELAEFQRQTARLAKAHPSPRASRKGASSPAKRAVGTRISARLRRSTRGATEDEDDDEDGEWQQVPDEWLKESASPSRRSSARTRAKGKAKAVETEDELPNQPAESDAEADAVAEDDAEAQDPEERGADADADADADGDGDAEVTAESTQPAPDSKPNGAAPPNPEDELLQKAGLESDTVSELTDLSEQEEDVPMAEAEASDPDDPPPAKKPNTRGRRSVGRRKSARQTRKAAPRARRNPSPAPEQDAQEEDPEPEPVEEHPDEPQAPPLPEGFVEWEAIAVTLPEWEHVADRFANATHYLEKALYKVLTQNIVPYVTAELREHEKRRRLEEAVVHRKRSSRIAMKESEKEEARLAAKKRAEEEEKMARAKRQEARLKKEEAERAKRERARDQRRKEREEREARARAKAERAERAESRDVDTSVARSTATPTVNGTHATSSVQPSRVVTPNGVHSPDWLLDCEICHKQGVNVDDGMAMVSCGSCNRWQHIACHDLNDQRLGRPRRNWEDQQFYCTRCRQRAMNGGAYGSHQQSSYPPRSHTSYSWTQSGHGVPVHKPAAMDPYSQTSDPRYAQRHQLENGTGYSQQQYSTNHVGAASYSRSSYPNVGLSMSHYQSDQRGMPPRGVVSSSVSPSSSWTNGNGYSQSAEHMSGRMQSAHFVPQYAHSGGVYASNRIPSAYQGASASIPSYPSSHDTPGTMSAARWPSSSTTNGYHGASGNAVQAAAESLAYMHDSGNRYGSSNWSQPSYGHGQSQTHSQSAHSSHSSYPPPPPPLGVDPLTNHPYPVSRSEQHVGSSLPNGGSSSSGSFNFPS
ncbi:hypothetical protein C8Q77DRAFT_1277460 [Trametes polyzona]|nr:hypothetical protein C8Q77DRAFT_1277460 [Trametes polyzona]